VPVLGLLREVYAKYLGVCEGTVASYIPELEGVAPDQFGMALVTADGHLYQVGDSSTPFTIQSISKPLVYGLALHDHGRNAVLARIGVEPSGDPFNAILFDDRTNRSFNSMVNTGAIVATSLVRGKDTEERMGRILDLLRALSGRAVSIDEGVYRSELATGHRNRAIAYLEFNNGVIEGDIEAHLNLYFRQCDRSVALRAERRERARGWRGGATAGICRRAGEPANRRIPQRFRTRRRPFIYKSFRYSASTW
jgi:glutaminase